MQMRIMRWCWNLVSKRQWLLVIVQGIPRPLLVEGRFLMLPIFSGSVRSPTFVPFEELLTLVGFGLQLY